MDGVTRRDGGEDAGGVAAAADVLDAQTGETYGDIHAHVGAEQAIRAGAAFEDVGLHAEAVFGGFEFL